MWAVPRGIILFGETVLFSRGSSWRGLITENYHPQFSQQLWKEVLPSWRDIPWHMNMTASMPGELFFFFSFLVFCLLVCGSHSLSGSSRLPMESEVTQFAMAIPSQGFFFPCFSWFPWTALARASIFPNSASYHLWFKIEKYQCASMEKSHLLGFLDWGAANHSPSMRNRQVQDWFLLIFLICLLALKWMVVAFLFLAWKEC